MRTDLLLVQRGLAPSRSAAQRLIERGAVERAAAGGWSALRKAGEELAEDVPLRVLDDAETRWASRAGLKLDAALAHAGLDVTGRACLDAGQSTGGFTDALLQRGAAKVVGIDVGHGQLHPKLAADERVQAFEGINARDVAGTPFAAAVAPQSFGFVTGDLSFISSTHVLPTLVHYLAPLGHLLLLVKPQFELQPHQIGKGGIVRDKALFQEVETRIRQACREQKLQLRAYFQSPITGGNGNTEFFVWAQAVQPQ